MRIEIHKLLSDIQPFDDTERKQISFAKELVLSGKEIYRIAKPDIPDTHLVAYCVLIDRKNNKLLLGFHKHSGLWLPPGGHCDRGELPQQTAQRELFEEMGIEADLLSELPLFLTITKTAGLQDNGHSDVGFWYVANRDSRLSINFDVREFERLQWFELADIPFEKTDVHMWRFIEKTKKQGVWNLV